MCDSVWEVYGCRYGVNSLIPLLVPLKTSRKRRFGLIEWNQNSWTCFLPERSTVAGRIVDHRDANSAPSRVTRINLAWCSTTEERSIVLLFKLRFVLNELQFYKFYKFQLNRYKHNCLNGEAKFSTRRVACATHDESAKKLLAQ